MDYENISLQICSGCWDEMNYGNNTSYSCSGTSCEIYTQYPYESGESSAAAFVADSTHSDVMVLSKVSRINEDDVFLAYLTAHLNTTYVNTYTLGISSGDNTTPNEPRLWLGKITNGAYSNIGGANGSVMPWGSGKYDWYDCNVKFVIIGNQLLGKVWKLNETEPVSWRVNATDSSFASGYSGVMVATYSPIGWNNVRASFENVTIVPLSQDTVYVNESWSSEAKYSEVLPGKIIGYNAFATIQEGINSVASGGTVNIAEGEYDECLGINKSVNVIGAGAEDTSVTGGINITGSSPWGSLLLESMMIKGDCPGDKTAVIDLHKSPVVSDFTIKNCILDGENVSTRIAFYGGTNYTGNLTFEGNKIRNFGSWMLIDNTGSVAPSNVKLPLNNVKFVDNQVYNCNGSISFRGMPSNKTKSVIIANNTMNGYPSEPSQCWAAIEITLAESLTAYNNKINNVPESIYGGEGQALQVFGIDSINIYNNDFSENFQGILFYGGSLGGTHGGPYAIPSGSMHSNNFKNCEDFAVTVEDTSTGGPLNATRNYWGSALDTVVNSTIFGNVTYHPYYIDEDMTVLATKGEDDAGNITLDAEKPYAVISDTTQEITITIEAEADEPMIDFSALVSSGAGEIPNITINSGISRISIPNTNITSENSSWNGVLSAPKTTTVTLPSVSGETRTLSTAIEIGLSDTKLSFDNAVRILFPGEKSKRVGYSRTGTSFTEITAVCGEDSQTWADANLAADSECKIDVGNDLVVWTNHFTAFSTFSSAPVEETDTRSTPIGGGCVYNPEFDWQCSEWSECIEGVQTRTCLERNNCGNTYGRPETEKECIMEETEMLPSEEAPFELFDIMMTLESPVLEKSNNLVAVVSFISFGNVPTPVDLTYEILDSSETQVYYEKSEITVQTEEVIRKSFESLNLPSGDYTLVLTTVYGEEVTDEFRQAFSVEESVSFNWTITIIVLAVISVIILGIILVSPLRKR